MVDKSNTEMIDDKDSNSVQHDPNSSRKHHSLQIPNIMQPITEEVSHVS